MVNKYHEPSTDRKPLGIAAELAGQAVVKKQQKVRKRTAKQKAACWDLEPRVWRLQGLGSVGSGFRVYTSCVIF